MMTAPVKADCTDAYVGRKSCGCVVAIAVINPAHPDRVAEHVAEWIREGLDIEKHSIPWARENFTGCDCEEVATPPRGSR